MQTVTKRGFLDMQVCVPKTWEDFEVQEFAEKENPCGTTAGWQIRREGSKYLDGSPERAQCQKYVDNVHIMLEA
jgi:hypothetical protein